MILRIVLKLKNPLKISLFNYKMINFPNIYMLAMLFYVIYKLQFNVKFTPVSPGINSRAELVPSPRAYVRNGATRRWLGEYYCVKSRVNING